MKLGNVGGHIAIIDEMGDPVGSQIWLKIESEIFKPVEIEMERYSEPKKVNKEGTGAIRELWRLQQINFDPTKDVDIKDMDFKVIEVLKGE